DLHAEPCDFVLVVQCRVADRRAAELNRLELCDRSQRSGPANLYANVQQLCCRLASAKLDRECPSRRFCRAAKFLLKFDRIDFNHHTVDFIVEVVAVFFPMAAEIHNLAKRPAKLAMRVDLESQPGNPFQILRLSWVRWKNRVAIEIQ